MYTKNKNQKSETLLVWNILVLKSKTIPGSAITSCGSQIGFSPFTTKWDFCKISSTTCEP